MYTISNNYINEINIKNSRFICVLYKIKTIDEVTELINKTKELYPDATHYCYAYIINNYKKASDDGEPGGTAGTPMLKVLENNNLTNILAIVIRYFGGIKLGASGLIRAYTKSVTTAINNITIKELIKGFNIDITFNYNQSKEIDYLLKDQKINNKIFKDNIIYNLDIEKNFLNIITSNKINYQINKEIDIEK